MHPEPEQAHSDTAHRAPEMHRVASGGLMIFGRRAPTFARGLAVPVVVGVLAFVLGTQLSGRSPSSVGQSTPLATSESPARSATFTPPPTSPTVVAGMSQVAESIDLTKLLHGLSSGQSCSVEVGGVASGTLRWLAISSAHCKIGEPRRASFMRAVGTAVAALLEPTGMSRGGGGSSGTGRPTIEWWDYGSTTIEGMIELVATDTGSDLLLDLIVTERSAGP